MSNNCHCKQCGNEWFSTTLASTGKPPKACPACHRYTWKEPRKVPYRPRHRRGG